MSFDANVTTSNGTAIVRMRGRIDRDAEAALEAACSDVAGDLELDFTAVDYINSSGIALIVGVLAQARKDARAVRAVGLTDHYREIFEVTRLSDFIEIL